MLLSEELSDDAVFSTLTYQNKQNRTRLDQTAAACV